MSRRQVVAHADGDSGGRYEVATVAISVMVLAVLLPYSIGALGPVITAGLGISAGQLGMLTGAVYLVAALSAGSLGRIAERLNLRLAVSLSYLLAFVSFAGMSISSGLLDALIFAAIGGCALAASNPVTNLLVVRAYPAAKLGAIMGWKQSGVPIAAAIAGTALGPLASWLGWRWALVVLGVVPLLLVTLAVRATPAGSSRGAKSDKIGRLRPLHIPRVRFLVLFSVCMGIGNGIITSYYALYSQSALGADTVSAAATIAVVGVVGTLARAFWTAHLGKWLVAKALTLLAAMSVLSSVIAILASQYGFWLMWIAAALSGAGAFVWLSVAMLALATGPRHLLAVTSGVVSQGFYLGLLIGPPLAGYLLDHGGGYLQVWVAQAFVYFAAFILGLRRWLYRGDRTGSEIDA